MISTKLLEITSSKSMNSLFLFSLPERTHSFEFCLLVLNDFVLIFTFCLFTSAMGHVVASIFEVKNSMDVAQSLASKGKLNDREMLHFNAAKALAAG